MISLVRYGFIGYHETNITLAFIFLALVTGALFALNYRIFDQGKYLRS
jgi:ABC-2 type transport system permease protein